MAGVLGHACATLAAKGPNAEAVETFLMRAALIYRAFLHPTRISTPKCTFPGDAIPRGIIDAGLLFRVPLTCGCILARAHAGVANFRRRLEPPCRCADAPRHETSNPAPCLLPLMVLARPELLVDLVIRGLVPAVVPLVELAVVLLDFLALLLGQLDGLVVARDAGVGDLGFWRRVLGAVEGLAAAGSAAGGAAGCEAVDDAGVGCAVGCEEGPGGVEITGRDGAEGAGGGAGDS